MVSGGAALATGIATAAATNTSDGLALAQAHEHGQQGGGEHAPITAAQQPAPEHEQRPPQLERPAPEGQQQRHMVMPDAPMHQMPGMMGMAHGSEAGEMGGHDMSPVDVSGAPAAAPDARGGQLLEPVARDEVEEFELTAGVVRWNILPDVQVGAYAYSGQVPGPTIRVRPNQQVRIRVKNQLPVPTTVHWHGMILPIEQDGVPELSQPPIPPGGEQLYAFTVANAPGTYFYHTHYNADRQQPFGLYGALIIDGLAPAPEVTSEAIVMLGESTVMGGETYPAMPFGDMRPNYFTINGKSYPATETVRARVGDRILFRLIGSGQFIHPIHIHGGPFQIVATDGNPVPEAAQLTKDTVLVGPGERYDVLWTARNPGKWLLHCHINHNVTNDGVETDGGGGMTMIIDVTA